MLKSSPVRVVPPARVDFTAEDRQWIADRIQKVLASGRLTLGTYGEEFERPFADYLGAKHAVAVNSGTSALEIIFRALGVEGRDARSGQHQLRHSSCRRSCRRTSGAHGYRGGDAGHGARGSRALHHAKHCGVPMVASELACSALFVVASSQRENGAPREGARGHNTGLIKTG